MCFLRIQPVEIALFPTFKQIQARGERAEEKVRFSMHGSFSADDDQRKRKKSNAHRLIRALQSCYSEVIDLVSKNKSPQN